jgi:hypothetical protein
VNTPGSHDSGGEYTGESITNTNNFLKSRKNLKPFLGMSNGTRSYMVKKIWGKKSRDTVPLSRRQISTISSL